MANYSFPYNVIRWGKGAENTMPFEGADESYPLEKHFHPTIISDIYSKNNVNSA